MADRMQATFVEQFGKPLVLREVDVLSPGPGQILVKTEACGVCHTDLHAAAGDWPVKPKLPFISGHQAIGRVAAIGAGVTAVKEGDRVGVPWLYSACGHCEHCLSAGRPSVRRRSSCPAAWRSALGQCRRVGGGACRAAGSPDGGGGSWKGLGGHPVRLRPDRCPTLATNVTAFLRSMGEILDAVPNPIGTAWQADEITVSAEVSPMGAVSLVGTGRSHSGGITFKLKRIPAS